MDTQALIVRLAIPLATAYLHLADDEKKSVSFSHIVGYVTGVDETGLCSEEVERAVQNYPLFKCADDDGTVGAVSFTSRKTSFREKLHDIMIIFACQLSGTNLENDDDCLAHVIAAVSRAFMEDFPIDINIPEANPYLFPMISHLFGGGFSSIFLGTVADEFGVSILDVWVAVRCYGTGILESDHFILRCNIPMTFFVPIQPMSPRDFLVWKYWNAISEGSTIQFNVRWCMEMMGVDKNTLSANTNVFRVAIPGLELQNRTLSCDLYDFYSWYVIDRELKHVTLREAMDYLCGETGDVFDILCWASMSPFQCCWINGQLCISFRDFPEQHENVLYSVFAQTMVMANTCFVRHLFEPDNLPLLKIQYHFHTKKHYELETTPPLSSPKITENAARYLLALLRNAQFRVGSSGTTEEALHGIRAEVARSSGMSFTAFEVWNAISYDRSLRFCMWDGLIRVCDGMDFTDPSMRLAEFKQLVNKTKVAMTVQQQREYSTVGKKFLCETLIRMIPKPLLDVELEVSVIMKAIRRFVDPTVDLVDLFCITQQQQKERFCWSCPKDEPMLKVLSVEKAAVEKAAVEKAAVEKAVVEKLAVEKAAAEKLAVEKAAAEKLAVEKAAAEKLAVEKAAAEKLAVEKAAAEKLAVEKAAAEKLAVEKAAAEKLAVEKAAAEKLAVEKAAAEKLAVEKAAAEKLAVEKAAAEKLAVEKAVAEKLAAEKLAVEKAAAEKLAVEKAVAEKLAAEKAAVEKAVAEKLAVEKAVAEKLAAEKAAVEKAAAEKLAVEKAAAEKLAAEKAVAENEAVRKLLETLRKADKAKVQKAAADKAAAKTPLSIIIGDSTKNDPSKVARRPHAAIIEIDSDDDDSEERHGKKHKSSYVANVMDAVKKHAEEMKSKRMIKRAIDVADRTLEEISPTDYQRCISRRGRIRIPIVDDEELTPEMWRKISGDVAGHVRDQFGGSEVVTVTVDDNGLILMLVVPNDEDALPLTSTVSSASAAPTVYSTTSPQQQQQQRHIMSSSSPSLSTAPSSPLVQNLIDDYGRAIIPEIVFARMKHYFGARDPGFTDDGSRIVDADMLADDFDMMKKCCSQQKGTRLLCQWEELMVFLFPPTTERERSNLRNYFPRLTGSRLALPENHARLFGKIRQGREMREMREISMVTESSSLFVDTFVFDTWTNLKT
jgi:hypothetical protein